MKELLVLSNAIISRCSYTNKKGKYRIAISIKRDNINDDLDSIICSDKFYRNTNLTELDFLVVKDKNNTLYIDSFEVKSRNGGPFSFSIQKQLAKQSLLLTLAAIDGFLLYTGNLCIILNHCQEKERLNINIGYIGGCKERDIKNIPLLERLDKLYGESYPISHISISASDTEYKIEYTHIFNYHAVKEGIIVPKEMWNFYKNLILENYKPIVNEFVRLNRSGHEVKLGDIIKKYENKTLSLDFEVLTRF